MADKKLAVAVAFLAIMLLCLSPNRALAQTTGESNPSLAAYNVQINVHEIADGKRAGTRNYNLRLEDNAKGSIRIGNRVPVPTTSGDKTSYQFVDVGLNLDCRLRLHNGSISLEINLEISDADQPASAGSTVTPPTIRQIRANVTAIVPLDKPTIVCSLDDAGEKRRYELEVTVTKAD